MIRLIAVLSMVLQLQQSPCTVRLLLVVPAGEHLTTDERVIYQQHALNAFVWWNVLAPTPMTLTISKAEVIAPKGDIYHHLRDWSLPYLTEDADITVFLIDNSQSNALLFDDSGGESQPYYRAAWIVMNGVPDAEAIIAHEVGHTRYGLEHPEPCTFPDIMCASGYVQPYREHVIGCQSLAALGRPCDRHCSLPVVVR